MPIYITLLKSTAEAARNVGEAEKWYEEGKKTFEKMGIRHIGTYGICEDGGQCRAIY